MAGSRKYPAELRERAVRMVALLVLVVTVVGAYVLFPAVRAKETLVDALWAAVFAANYRFQALGADYFQQDLPPSPLQHYWSLSIEEQFYFVWPFLLVVIFALTRRRARRGDPRIRQWGLFAGMFVSPEDRHGYGLHGDRDPLCCCPWWSFSHLSTSR